ncbi:T9SS type A sorting domain-containing protein [Flavobacterium sp. Root420]|uniref:T9SS type A sorting domain-containing protein n=1 Tax=Flavobacterium sp. Root420 TaxID=1736533 RepID=UPI00070167DB|nr:T9SS type A sorting domain-containing protein [Flavobacterium sp. Root420]KQX15138.1 hypothetical protein ASC72_18265 [Flavobacterium sp. Root420]
MKNAKLLLNFFFFFAVLSVISTYGQTVTISNLRYTNGALIPNGSAIEIYEGGSKSVTFDLKIDNPLSLPVKGYLYVMSKKSSSASSSLQYLNVDFNNNTLSSWYSKEFTISLNATNFSTTGGRLYGQFDVTSSSGGVITGNIIPIKVIPSPPLQNNTIYLDNLAVLATELTGGLGINSYQYTWFITDKNGDKRQLPDSSPNLMLTTPQFAPYLNSVDNFTIMRMVTSGSQSVASNTIPIPHISPIQNNIISNNGYYVTGSVPTGGIGDYTYSWALLATSTYIELDETTKDLDLTSHPNFFDGSLLIRIVTAGIFSTSNKLALNAITAKALNKENMVTSAVYPNPTSGSINFTTGFSSNKEIEIIVYSEGLRNAQSVFKGTSTPNQIIKWDIPSNYSKGIYYYKIISDNKEVKSGKILFQ